LNFFGWQYMNKKNCVIYHKIEHQKLNRTSYLHSLFPAYSSRLIRQILSLSGHFLSEKIGQLFHCISYRSVNLWVPRLNFTYVVQLFFLYKMVKKNLKKKFPIDSKNDSQCWPTRYHFLRERTGAYKTTNRPPSFPPQIVLETI
jgi:hypothetical protein